MGPLEKRVQPGYKKREAEDGWEKAEAESAKGDEPEIDVHVSPTPLASTTTTLEKRVQPGDKKGETEGGGEKAEAESGGEKAEAESAKGDVPEIDVHKSP